MYKYLKEKLFGPIIYYEEAYVVWKTKEGYCLLSVLP